MWVLKIRKGVVQGHLDPQILSGKDLKMSKIRPYFKDFRLKIGSFSYLWTKKVRQLVDLDEVGTFGVKDVIFRLCEEVEEGVDGANKSEL